MNDTNSSPLKRLKRSRPAQVGALVVLAGVVWAGFHFFGKKESEVGEYIFAGVQTGDIEDLVTATGTLDARDYVDVGAQVSGQVEKIYVEVGDEVKQGQLMMEIDATQSAARVDANRANLRSQESTMQDRLNTLAKAERDYERQQNLFKDDATTAETVQNAETTLKSARQAIISLQATIDQQKASMRVEETNLRFTKIVAPISGTVVSIAVKQGQTLNATQQAPTLMRIADLAVMSVKTDVSEADVAKLTRGMDAYFTTLGGQNRRWRGQLKRVEPTPKVQQSVVLYNAVFDVENNDRALMPQMTAQVFFVRAEARNVLVVPMAALQQGQQIARANAEKQKQGAAAAKPAGSEAAPAAGAVAQNGSAPPAAGGAMAAAEGGQTGNGQRGPGGQGGDFSGQRPGGAGGFGGFNGGQPPTPEQMEQFRKMREQRMAQRGGEGGPGGGFGPGGFSAQQQRGPQQRRGIVMVKLADGKLEQRNVVIGTTNRVHGEVLSGLKEGEEVVVGKHEAETAAAAPANNQNNQNRPQGFPQGGFRPF
jgi:macrolide-specific efflux system membrane fusion protein